MFTFYISTAVQYSSIISNCTFLKMKKNITQNN